jgi:hypothetical protein
VEQTCREGHSGLAFNNHADEQCFENIVLGSADERDASRVFSVANGAVVGAKDENRSKCSGFDADEIVAYDVQSKRVLTTKCTGKILKLLKIGAFDATWWIDRSGNLEKAIATSTASSNQPEALSVPLYQLWMCKTEDDQCVEKMFAHLRSRLVRPASNTDPNHPDQLHIVCILPHRMDAPWWTTTSELGLCTARIVKKGTDMFRVEEERTVFGSGPPLYRKTRRTTENYVVLTSWTIVDLSIEKE